MGGSCVRGKRSQGRQISGLYDGINNQRCTKRPADEALEKEHAGGVKSSTEKWYNFSLHLVVICRMVDFIWVYRKFHEARVVEIVKLMKCKDYEWISSSSVTGFGRHYSGDTLSTFSSYFRRDDCRRVCCGILKCGMKF
mgnify:CR=1 FL=1